jgi:hydroxyacylglutathione hydrolase
LIDFRPYLIDLDLEIIGSEVDNVEGCSRYVKDGEEFELDEIKILCLETPGHTMGHICYYAQDQNHPDQSCVFTGDTLFCGGVGKFFEGTANHMNYSLQKLIQLPLQTEVYCGHEYTLSNYRFALSIDQSNEELIQDNERAILLRNEGKFTVPSTIGKELKVNPFLRVLEPAIRSNFPLVSQNDPIALLAAVREAKNNF